MDIAQVFLTRLIIKLEVLLCVSIQETEISHFHCTGTLSFDSVIGNANSSGVVNVDEGWRLCMPSSLRVRRRTLASLTLRKRAPNWALAADAETSLRMVQVMWIGLLSLIGLPSMGKLPRKK